ncbi:hypothetical protein FisN_12Hh234 [Fistulifera solaris]|uniref:F-box domain-containing protein n=1 Tax=Fistulifera solaris TaxID=1519565 RepID=A0A1Z5KBJ1_FISSO|nr:hypothetical protein FisN_12Hh234 [Fistulifera solaris]|eukprot:GAX23660.1 hypothetical protein FisN_12Hh234 [Fistulifera solaris]
MNDDDDSYFPIIHLPAELKRRTASYLCPYDALRLAETCRNLHSSLSLRLLRDSRQLFTRQRFVPTATNGDDILPWVRIPCLSRRVHSITVTFRWRDQGWGHHKGQIYIVGRSRQIPADLSRPFQGGRVVCVSSLAPHQEEACKLTFSTCSMEGETYQMWYRVGGGGGHQLLLSDGRIHTVLFDDEAGNFSRNYIILKEVGAIAAHPEAELPRTHSSFYPQLLLRVSMTIRLELALRAKRQKRKSRKQEEEDSVVSAGLENNPLVAFFQMYRIEVTEDSLAAVEEIIQCEAEEQASTQGASVPPAPPSAEDGGFLDDFRDLLVGVGMEFLPADPRRRVVRLNMQPLRAEIEVQQMLQEDDMSDDTTNESNDDDDDDEDEDHDMHSVGEGDDDDNHDHA